MGLRIGTNIQGLTALRALGLYQRRENSTFEKLSTGLRINRASDNPAGLVLLEQLRSELTSIQQATENTQSARNMVNVADSALSQISDRIAGLRATAVAAQNTGVIGPRARQALQSVVNQNLNAIDRIARTTRFADQPLLNGNFEFQITAADTELEAIDVQGGQFTGGFPFTVNVNVTAAATRAQATGTISAAPQSAASTIRISGPRGSQDINLAAGASQQDVIDTFNEQRENTGVEATATGEIRTLDSGSAFTLNLQEISGDLEGITPGLTRGTDIVAQVQGEAASGQGNTVTFNGTFQAELTVTPDTTGAFQFTIAGGGARFQLGPTSGGANNMMLGIPNVGTDVLGRTSGEGTLASLVQGGGADLSTNPARTISILNAASREVTALRGRLGAVSDQVFEPNIQALGVAFENLSASRSILGDTNFAEEISKMVRNRLVREAGFHVLRQTNLNAGMALRLLG